MRLSVPVTYRQNTIHVATSSFMTMDYSLLLYSLWVPVILAVEGKCERSLLRGYWVSELLLWSSVGYSFYEINKYRICNYKKLYWTELAIYLPRGLFGLENFAFDENLNVLVRFCLLFSGHGCSWIMYNILVRLMWINERRDEITSV